MTKLESMLMLRKYPENLIRVAVHEARYIEQNMFRHTKTKHGLCINLQSQLFDVLYIVKSVK